MPKIITIVEGEGDILAGPTLLYKIIHDLKQYQWHVARPYKTHNLGTLKKNLSSLLWKASRRKDCGAILILLDLDNGCPKEEALALADLIRSLNLASPVAIVFAYREYEAWFLATLSSIAGHYDLPSDVVYEGDVEAKRNVKGWLKAQMRQGVGYNPVIHQKKFTSLIDIEVAYEQSRSFRRLYNAIVELLAAAEKGERGYVSPRKE